MGVYFRAAVHCAIGRASWPHFLRIDGNPHAKHTWIEKSALLVDVFGFLGTPSCARAYKGFIEQRSPFPRPSLSCVSSPGVRCILHAKDPHGSLGQIHVLLCRGTTTYCHIPFAIHRHADAP
jgi:hypothetical protein